MTNGVLYMIAKVPNHFGTYEQCHKIWVVHMSIKKTESRDFQSWLFLHLILLEGAQDRFCHFVLFCRLF